MITLSEQGLHCEAGGFHIDPMKRVETAVITHAHSDHARRGSDRYLCSEDSVALLRCRLGENAKIEGVPYGKPFGLGPVKVSFHPAGHILGSAQVRMELDGEVWVATGDYKREPDPTCAPFEVVHCDTLITEATFGNPRYCWSDTDQVMEDLFQWWEGNRARGRNSLLYCYAVGKAQRVLAELALRTDRPVYVFGETALITERYREQGVRMLPTRRLEDLPESARLEGELIVAPHAIARTSWPERLGDHESAFASGWMQGGAWWIQNRYDRGFVISDHADWSGLVKTIEQSGARRVLILHGKEGSALKKHLTDKGIQAEMLVRESKRVKHSAQAPKGKRNSAPDKSGVQLDFFRSTP